jgi:hypothetical protein
MLLTITIASVSVRSEMLENLLSELNKQIAENNSENEIEILIDSDDYRFLGTKRKLMLSQAKGLFTCAIDDDDFIYPNYIKNIIEAIKKDTSVDCLGINGIITTNGLNPKKWVISCHYEDWFEEDDIYYRTPNHICPIKTELVKIANFDDVAWGEDYPFSQRIKSILKTETTIEEPLYHYQYSTENSLYNYQNEKNENSK